MVDSLVLKSNEFGSVQGTFYLPENLLGGEFSIYDETTQDEQSFSVEEYKRPGFYIEFDSVKTAYRVLDTIQLGGMAQAYAGNAIDDAKFNYRVYRETLFPYHWMMFRDPGSGAEVEVAQGEGITDANGKFNIHFPALADQSVSKLTQPVYHYRVETTITDASDESRIGTVVVSASYRSFEIVSAIGNQEQIDRDSLYQIPVTTRNASGLFVKKSLTLILHALQAPERLIRKRYWEQPDLFVMAEKEFTDLFPNDEYRDESDPKNWTHASTVYQKTDSTTADGLFQVDNRQLNRIAPGWYELEIRATDIDGTEVIDKKFIQVSAHNEKPAFRSYSYVRDEMVSGEPGQR
jgi:hypothetical protein